MGERRETGRREGEREEVEWGSGKEGGRKDPAESGPHAFTHVRARMHNTNNGSGYHASTHARARTNAHAYTDHQEHVGDDGGHNGCEGFEELYHGHARVEVLVCVRAFVRAFVRSCIVHARARVLSRVRRSDERESTGAISASARAENMSGTLKHHARGRSTCMFPKHSDAAWHIPIGKHRDNLLASC